MTQGSGSPAFALLVSTLLGCTAAGIPAAGRAQAGCELETLEIVGYSSMKREESGDFSGSDLVLVRDGAHWTAFRRTGEGPVSGWNRADSTKFRPRDHAIDLWFPPFNGNLAERMSGSIDCQSARLRLSFGRATIDLTLLRARIADPPTP